MKKRIAIWILLFGVILGTVVGHAFREKGHDSIDVQAEKRDFYSKTKKEDESLALIENLKVNYSWDEILECEDIELQRALVKEYAESMIPEELLPLLDELKNIGDRNAVIIFSVLTRKDFNLAKDYLLDQNIRKNTATIVRSKGNFYFQNRAIFKQDEIVLSLIRCFCAESMKFNPIGCFQFIREIESIKNEVEAHEWKDVFFDYVIKEYPKETYDFLIDSQRGSISATLYLNWYRKDPFNALNAIFSIEDIREQDGVFGAIASELIDEDPLDAIEFINDYCSESYKYNTPIKVFNALLRIDSESALDFLLSGSISNDLKNKAYQSLLANLSVNKIRNLLENSIAGIDTELIKEIINNNLESVGVRDGGIENVKDVISLLNYLDETERSQTINKITKGDYGMISLLLYDEEDMHHKLPWRTLRAAADENIAFTVDFFVNHLECSENKGKDFYYLLKDYSVSDPEGAKAYVQSIKHDELKDEINIFLSSQNWQESPQKAMEALYQYPQNFAARESFMEIIYSLSEYDIDMLILGLKSVPHDDWAMGAIQCSSKALLSSPAVASDIIDALDANPERQEMVIKEAALEYTSSSIPGLMKPQYETALDFALRLKPGEETNKIIINILNKFKNSNASAARYWCERNGIPWRIDQR